ncbi:MAG: hypothetical protein K0R24_2031 [Gammaproteobacteria bacterium]|jgi:hypothetical protein|nr:hypothetical protein [Gammaproteobacteria bacterium]
MKNSWIKKLFEEVLQKQKQKGLNAITADSIIQHLVETISREIKEESDKKLRDTLAAAEDAAKKKKIEAEENAIFKEKLQKQIDEINDWLEKKRREAEEERKKLEAILMRMFLSLRQSSVVTSEELAPGILVHAAHCIIFEAQEADTRDYFNGVISEPEFNQKKREKLYDYVNEAINQVINNRPASERERLQRLKAERIEGMVDRIYEKTEIERQANPEYANAMANSKALRATQQFRNINQINRDVSQIKMVHKFEKKKTAATQVKQQEASAPVAAVEEVKEDANKQESDEAKNILKAKTASTETSSASIRRGLPKKDRSTFSSEPKTPTSNNSEPESLTPKIGRR